MVSTCSARVNARRPTALCAWSWAWLGAALTVSSPALASDDYAPGDGGPGSLPARGNGLAAEVSVGAQDQAMTLQLSLIMAVDLPAPSLGCIDPTSLRCITRFRVGARLPLEHTLAGAQPASAPGSSRAWSDVLQLRYLEYGYADEPVHVLFGELSGASVGHGTLVNEYYNVLHQGRFKLGMQAHLNSPYAGAEVLVDDLARPSLVGARAYVRPLALLTGHPLLHQIGLGTSFITDLRAPLVLLRSATGHVALDARGRPLIAQQQAASFLASDLELDLVHVPRLRLGAYADLNSHLTRGTGVHAGVRLKVDPLRAVALSARLERRWLGAGYLPDYFGPLYELERDQALLGHAPGAQGFVPKLALTQLGPTQSARQGTHAQVSGTLLDMMTLSAALSKEDEDAHAVMWIRFVLAPTDIYSMSIFYYKSNLRGASGVFDPGDSMLSAEARLGIIWPVYLFGQYSDLWTSQRDAQELTQLSQWRAGLGASLTF